MKPIGKTNRLVYSRGGCFFARRALLLERQSDGHQPESVVNAKLPVKIALVSVLPSNPLEPTPVYLKCALLEELSRRGDGGLAEREKLSHRMRCPRCLRMSQVAEPSHHRPKSAAPRRRTRQPTRSSQAEVPLSFASATISHKIVRTPRYPPLSGEFLSEPPRSTNEHAKSSQKC